MSKVYLQEKLIAGSGITIEGNTISAEGGNSSSGIVTLTENGVYDIADYAAAIVNVNNPTGLSYNARNNFTMVAAALTQSLFTVTETLGSISVSAGLTGTVHS